MQFPTACGVGVKRQITVQMAVLVTTAAVVAGCSSTAPPPELAGTQVVSVPGSDLLSVPHGGMKVQVFNNRRLVGPHYTLGIAWVATGQWIDAKSASDLGIHQVRAPKGRDLVVVAVAPEASTAAFKPSAPPPAEVLVDGKGTPLPGVPLPDSGGQLYGTGKLILLSAEPHALLQLRVTDDGKAQMLDLRTGATSGDGYWQRQSAVGWKGESPVVVPDTSGTPGLAAWGAGTLSVSNPGALSRPHRGDYAILNNYRGGWAAQGQAFLTVPVPNLSGTSDLLMMSGEPHQVRFDDAAAFSFTPANGRTVPADSAIETLPLSNIADFTDVSTVVFHVPDNTTTGTLTFDLRKSQLIDNNGKTFSWTKPPQPFTLNLAFTQ
jgi:hypothetical protein